jgi:aminoglycoside phosphotransferase (APT) family kinase protein
MNDMIHTLQKRLKLIHNATKIEEIQKGYSPDKKYIVHTNNEKLLVRIGDIESYKRKEIEFQLLKEMQNLKVTSPKPLDIGVMEEFHSCYQIFSFIDGVDANVVIKSFTDEEQYQVGVDAGIQLARMHEYKAPPTIDSWYERAMAKHYRYVDAYKSCGVKVNNDEKILDFIERNKQYIKNRPNQFQHDDFHLGNIIVKDKKFAGVIDFNNYDWGDPLHDFVKVALFQRELSVPFSIGQIEGYCNHNVSEDFWRMYAIYGAMVIFSSVVWSLRFVPEQLDEMMERLYVILEDHKNFEVLKPTWYEQNYDWAKGFVLNI